MSEYTELLEALLATKSILIKTTVTGSAIRKGLAKAIETKNTFAAIMDTATINKVVSIALVSNNSGPLAADESEFLIKLLSPEEVSNKFKPKFKFSIIDSPSIVDETEVKGEEDG